MAEPPPDDIGAISALADPVRRAAYRTVVAGGDAPVGRDEVAAALGVGRTLAGFHLDKLVDAGLLEASYARRSGRAGPGAGRPAKLYRRSPVERSVSVPPRDYRAAAELLAEAVERAEADGALQAVARERGREAGAVAENLIAALESQGYEPERIGDAVRMRNCPFHQLSDQFPALVCGMNLALVEGIAEACAPDVDVRLDRGRAGCCVAVSF